MRSISQHSVFNNRRVSICLILLFLFDCRFSLLYHDDNKYGVLVIYPSIYRQIFYDMAASFASY